MSSSADITELLEAWAEGDRDVEKKLLEEIEPELRRRAHRELLREPGRISVETSELVNETYLRLVRQDRATWHNRAHFYAVCAQLMRRILVDRVRSKKRQKRGGGAVHLDLDDVTVGVDEPRIDLLALDRALDELEDHDPVAARLVEARYFAGLTVEEAAEATGISRTSAVVTWRYAKAWLRRAIEGA